MGFDKAELQEAETTYLECRSEQAMARYYGLLVRAAPLFVRKLDTKHRRQTPADKVEEIAHDAATRLLAMYLKRPTFRAGPVAVRLFKEVQEQMTNRTLVLYETRVGSLDDDHPLPGATEPGPDETGYVREVFEDGTVEGYRIIMTLFDSRFFRTAVKKISGYTPRAWIYRNVVKLHTIFKMTRGKA